MAHDRNSNERRIFLKQAGLAGLGSLASAELASATDDSANTSAGRPKVDPVAEPLPGPYYSLGPDEAAFVEALVNHMCPEDEWSPSGVACGLAAYIDRQLAGPFGKGAGRYQLGPFRQGKPQMGLQLPLTPEQFFKAGIGAINESCLRQRGAAFPELAPTDSEAVLEAVAGGRLTDDRVPLQSWFNELVYPLFVEACFADPIYGGNRNAVFWKMIGYPGLPATHTLDMVRHRGKPYPGARSPKSIGDFS